MVQPVECPCGVRLGRHDPDAALYRESRVGGKHGRCTRVERKPDGRVVVSQFCPACGATHDLVLGRAA